MPERFYAVDRIDKRHAYLIGDGGDEHQVPLAQLPAKLAEGDVLRVPLAGPATPDWAGARRDPEEAERRRREAEELLKKLRRRDPGGDVDL